MAHSGFWAGGHQCALPPPLPALLENLLNWHAAKWSYPTFGTNSSQMGPPIVMWAIMAGHIAPRDLRMVLHTNQYLFATVGRWLRELMRKVLAYELRQGPLTRARLEIRRQLMNYPDDDEGPTRARLRLG